LTPLDRLPVWSEAGLLFAAMLAAFELAGRLQARNVVGEGGKEAYLVSAAVGLLALLLGFTFNLALSHYDVRRTLVVQEANAIAEVGQRIDLLAPTPRSAEHAVLLRYARSRVDLARVGEDPAAIARVEAATDAEQAALWATMTSMVPSPTAGSWLMQPLDTMFAVAVSRRAALASRIPTQVALVLGLYALITAAILGYAMAYGRLRHRAMTTALFALLAITVGLILDLDRPRNGLIHIDQEPLQTVLARLQAG